MNRNSHNFRISSVNLAPRWRIAFISLMLAFAIGSVSLIPTAQAAPSAELVYFSMKVQNPKTTLRCGQTVTYFVQVEVAQTNGAPTPAPGSFGFPKGQSVVNVKVEAFSVDKSVGDFVGTEKGYATAKTAVVFDDDLTALGAKFRFKANKPGKTTLYFEGLVGKEYVSAKLDVKVLPCKYKVTTIGEWHVPGPANLFVAAISDDAEVKAADAQSPVTGSTTVNWVASGSGVGDCPPAVIEIGSSRVEWTGELEETGQFTLDGTYLPTQGSVSVNCGTSGTIPIQLALDPLQVNLTSSGGVFKQSQLLQGPEATPGYATIVVIPVDDEAAAFLSGEHQASWDDFSNLLVALLALP